MPVVELKTGDVIELNVGLKCYHNQNQALTEILEPALVVVETTRDLEPMQVTGVDAHFERCFMVKARALNKANGKYHPEGALLTFAQFGDFRPEFVLPEANAKVLRRLVKAFLPPDPIG
jgi:hypothetical protein